MRSKVGAGSLLIGSVLLACGFGALSQTEPVAHHGNAMDAYGALGNFIYGMLGLGLLIAGALVLFIGTRKLIGATPPEVKDPARSSWEDDT